MTLAPATPLIAVKRLDWDTDFFGAPMGTLQLSESTDVSAELLEAELRIALARAESDGFQHLIFRTSATDLSLVWAAQRAGLRLVDIGVDSTIRIGDSFVPAPARLTVRLARPDETPRLREMGEAFTLSRFSADPFFSEAEVLNFHRQWITNLCTGLAAVVLVCEIDGEAAGFVACTFSGTEGRIALIASQAKFRRRGIGRELVNAALRWFAANRAHVAHVKTQAHNYPALALYHSAGFAVSKTELTFSTVLLKEPGVIRESNV